MALTGVELELTMKALAAAGDPRTDRTDGHATDLRGFVVRHPDHLREHEGVALIAAAAPLTIAVRVT